MWSLLAAFALAAPPVLSEPERAFYKGDLARAAALCAEALGRDPGDLRARLVLGRTEAARGRFEAAYDAFRTVLRKDPSHPDALYYLGVTAGVLAQAEYERLGALAPDSARAHQLRGESLRAQGRNEDAVQELQAA